MRLPKIRIERIATLSVSMLLCFITIALAHEDLESHAHNDNSLADEAKSSDEDEQKNSSLNGGSPPYAPVDIPSSSAAQGTCNEDKIMYYLAEIQVINPETILQIASYSNVAVACREFQFISRSGRKVEETLGAMDAWMLGCDPPPATDMYMRLTAGLRILDEELCAPSDYQQDFKEHLECYQQLHNEYIDCMGPADWIVNMEDHKLCKQYKVIADCYYIRTAMLCGTTAAKTLKEFVVRIINAVVQTHCPEVNKNPVVLDSTMDHDVYARTSSSNKIKPHLVLYALLLLTNRLFIAFSN